MLKIVLATRNAHKYRELSSLLRVPGIRYYSLAEFPHMRSVVERGRTFAENASIKARAAASTTGAWAIADDSGIEVDALRGAPGVRSARFAGRHGNDRANNDKLLQMLRGRAPSQRRARYRCVLALARPGLRRVALSVGMWEGCIAERPQGRGGFGYDPIFWLPRLRKTAAQISATAKNRLSHRANAAEGMRRQLRRFVNGRAASRTNIASRTESSGRRFGPS